MMHEHDPAGTPLRVERTGALLRVVLDRQTRANALNRDIVERFLETLDDSLLMRDVRALVIEGSGQNFCGGFDLSRLGAQDDATFVVRFLRIETLLQRLYHAPIVTIACAHGNAIGAGADLFAACTYRIAAPGTTLRMPGWQFGIALGTRRLCDRIGTGPAREILSQNRALDAAEALACGLATHVAERESWPSIVERLVETARALSPEALARLHALSVRDHRDGDMAALVASAFGPPGLKERLIAYVAARPLRSSDDKGSGCVEQSMNDFSSRE